MLNKLEIIINMKKNFILLIILSGTFIPEKTQCQMGEFDTTKTVNWAAIPIINYDPSFEFMFGAMTSAFYRLDKNDTISPPSVTGIFVMATTNGSWFGALFQKLYLQQDNWRITAAAGKVNVNFQFYMDIPIIGGKFIGFNSEASMYYAKVLRQTWPNLYLGVHGAIVPVTTDFDINIGNWSPSDSRQLNFLGYDIEYDSRDNVNNPSSGINGAFGHSLFRDWMGSDNDYNSFELTLNHYTTIKNKKNVLASRFSTQIAHGDVPFQGQNVVMGDDIRGYTNGKHRANQIYALQTEYRWNFYKKFGLVGFFGLASAVESFNNLSDSEVLPGAGFGLRYMMIPSERINVGFDIATGKDDWGIYFRIGEAFAR